MTERETGRGTLYIDLQTMGYCGFTSLTLTLVSILLYGRHQSAVILQLRIELRHIPLWRFEWRISQSQQQLYRRSNHDCQSCLSKCVFEMRMGINRKYSKCQCCHLFVHKYSSMWPYWPLKLGFRAAQPRFWKFTRTPLTLSVSGLHVHNHSEIRWSYLKLSNQNRLTAAADAAYQYTDSDTFST